MQTIGWIDATEKTDNTTFIFQNLYCGNQIKDITIISEKIFLRCDT